MKAAVPAILLLLAGCATSALPRPSAAGDPEARLRELQLTLPSPSAPIASYVNAVRTGNLVFLSGKGPRKPDGLNITGKVGRDLTVDEGYAAARLTALHQLAALKAELGDLKRVRRIVKVLGLVNCEPSFTDHSKVINGFSDLMVEVFGDAGRHARSAIGAPSLPGGMAVEVEMIVEVD